MSPVPIRDTIPPTRPQARALAAIRKLSKDGAAPSYREVMREGGFTNMGSFQEMLTRMRDRGLVTFEPRRARSLRVVGELPGLEKWSTPELRALFRQVRGILASRFDA